MVGLLATSPPIPIPGYLSVRMITGFMAGLTLRGVYIRGFVPLEQAPVVPALVMHSIAGTNSLLMGGNGHIRFSIPKELWWMETTMIILVELNNSTTASASSCSFNDQVISDSTGAEYICLQKLEIMKRALVNVIQGDPTDATNNGVSAINLGLMRFNYNSGGRNGGTLIDAVAPVDALEDPDSAASATNITNRADFVNKVQNMRFELNTPLAESMFEAYRYFDADSPVSSEASPRISGQETLDPYRHC